MAKIIDILTNYKPFDEQEEKDKQFFLECEKQFGDILTRDNEFCHLCSSVFIINSDKTKVLCIYHNLYNSWGWVGGHADGDSDLEHVAEKEAREETSIHNLRLLSHVPISLDTLPVSGHFKRGKYVPAHIHLSIAYLYEADEEELIRIKEDENSGVEWLTFDELLNKSTEPHMLKVYSKIINKIKQYNTT